MRIFFEFGTQTRAHLAGAVLLGALAFWASSCFESATSCETDSDCYSGEVCRARACVRADGPSDVEDDTPDSAKFVDGTDERGDTDDEPPAPKTNAYSISSGGGHAASDHFEVRVGFGGASPRQSASGEEFEVRLNPPSP